MGKKSDLESVHLVNHSKCMLAAFQNFRQDETMLDVTLVCNGMHLKAHKLVLSACSPFFKEIFSENPCAHPVIILRAFEFSDLKAIIDFIYKGELSVPRERLTSALKVAEELQIRGLRRSEPNREKYEKLYNQVRGKLSAKKKRKRHYQNSSDSEENECVSIPDSDQNVVESDGSSQGNEDSLLESQQMMEVETPQENSEKDTNIRPVVLRVGDPATNTEEEIAKNSNIEEGNLVCMPENSASLIEEIENLDHESVSESDAATLQLNTFIADSESSVVSLGNIPTEEQNSSQEQNTESMSLAENSDALVEEQNSEPMSVAENSESLLEDQNTEPVSIAENSDDQDGLTSSSCMSPKFIETQQTDEIILKNEGKRFICSKCDSIFTSRISFMRHKSLGHTKKKKSSYECKQCDFATEDLDCFKNHSQVHSDKVPYKCSSCPEEFTSEELYQDHLCVHEEKKTLHSLSSAQDLLSMQNRNPEKNQEFRCSICFKKFISKLSCQLHEKACQGGD